MDARSCLACVAALSASAELFALLPKHGSQKPKGRSSSTIGISCLNKSTSCVLSDFMSLSHSLENQNSHPFYIAWISGLILVCSVFHWASKAYEFDVVEPRLENPKSSSPLQWPRSQDCSWCVDFSFWFLRLCSFPAVCPNGASKAITLSL